MFSCGDEINSKLFCEKIIDSIDILKDFLVSNFCIEQLTNEGGGSPGQNLTLRKNVSLVVFPNSPRTTQNVNKARYNIYNPFL